MDIFQNLPLDEGGICEYIGSERRLFCFFFIYRISWFLFLFLFLSLLSSRDAVILLAHRNVLRKVRVSKEDDRAARSPFSRASFKISMKSQFYHHNSFTSTSLIFFNVFLFYFTLLLFFFFLLFSLFPRYFFLARSRARFACLWKVILSVLSTFLIQSRTRGIARSSHGIKYATERVDC